MKEMTFLINPRGKRSRRKASKRVLRRKRHGVRKARRVVKAQDRAARIPRRRQRQRRHRAAGAVQLGGFMARKRKHSRRHAHARTNTPRRGRRRFRRNPPIGSALRGVVPFVMDSAIDAALGVAGVVAVRKGRSLTGQLPGTPLALATEGLIALGLGYGLSRVNKRVGANVARGGLMAPMMTFLVNAKIPVLSESLGDDGIVLGDGLGAYIGDEDVAGYIGAGGSLVPADRVGDAVGYDN